METWVEKYRPRSLDDIVSQNRAVERLKQLISDKNLPNMIFTGPSGTGKTSAALALVNDFYSIHYPDTNMRRVFLRNASDELRMSKGDLDDLKDFVNEGLGVSSEFKFVILEEADRIGIEVQSMLRRIIENAPSNVRFIFTNNYIENLIDPLVSRCSVYRFYPVPEKEAIEFAEKVLAAEKVTGIKKDDLKLLYLISRGDLRKFINNLQFIAKHSDEKEFNIADFFGIFPKGDFAKVLSDIENADFSELMKTASKKLDYRGVILQFFDHFKYRSEDIVLCLGDFDMRFASKCNESLQMRGLLSKLALIMNGETEETL